MDELSLRIQVNKRFKVLHTVHIIDSIRLIFHPPLLLVFGCRCLSFTRR